MSKSDIDRLCDLLGEILHSLSAIYDKLEEVKRAIEDK